MIKLDDIRRHAAVRPERVALVDGSTRLGWARFAEHVEAVAAGLAALLPRDRPSRAVFLTENRWELAVAMAACATLGVPCTGLDPEADRPALASVATALLPELAFVSTAQHPLLERLGLPADTVRVVLDGVPDPARATVPFARLLTTRPPHELPAPQPFEELTVVPDAAGGPRVAVRRRPVAGRRTVDLVDQFGFDSSDIHLAAAPLSEPTALALTQTFLGLGATLVLVPRLESCALAATISEERATTMTADPATLLRLINHDSARLIGETTQLHCVITLGRHLNRWAVNAAWERLGPVLHLAQAGPEVGLYAMTGPDELHVAPLRSGRMLLGSTLAVLDEAGEPVPAGQTGRIALGGHQLLNEYLDGEPPATVTLDLGEGPQRMLLTEDLGRLDEQGRLVVTGGGGSVPTVRRTGAIDAELFRLEADLLSLPYLRDAAVLRAELPVLGDCLVLAFVAVSAEREANAQAALEAVCARRVPSLPAHAVAVDRIPYSPTGAIRSAELLETAVPMICLDAVLERQARQQQPATPQRVQQEVSA
ncbi:AMP-binding protein [Kitasatospora sp. NPDC002227]|uniref:AMP-binding protein n=1 Tax=Kitasatospora sp. NPDC002227 TaxID=3154773 RepID=UPI003328C1D4